MRIEVRIDGKKGQIDVRDDGTFYVVLSNGVSRGPTQAEKTALASSVAIAVASINQSRKEMPKHEDNGDEEK